MVALLSRRSQKAEAPSCDGCQWYNPVTETCHRFLEGGLAVVRNGVRIAWCGDWDRVATGSTSGPSTLA